MITKGITPRKTGKLPFHLKWVILGVLFIAFCCLFGNSLRFSQVNYKFLRGARLDRVRIVEDPTGVTCERVYETSHPKQETEKIVELELGRDSKSPMRTLATVWFHPKGSDDSIIVQAFSRVKGNGQLDISHSRVTVRSPASLPDRVEAWFWRIGSTTGEPDRF